MEDRDDGRRAASDARLANGADLESRRFELLEMVLDGVREIRQLELAAVRRSNVRRHCCDDQDG